MTETPLSSNDFGKIFVFALLLIPTVFIGLGAIPALLLAFGFFMMKKTGDFDHIRTAVRNYNIYCALAIAGTIVITIVSAYEYVPHFDSADDFWRERATETILIGMAFVTLFLLYIFLARFLLLQPLTSHRQWIESKGIFFTNRGPSATEDKEIDIIRGERMRSFSVADELTKWAKLKEEGHITDQEFSDARRKLLDRG